MSVEIVDPPDSSVFPYDEGWTATAIIDSTDAVSGVIMDYNTNDVYPSPGPSGTGPDPNGLYTWQVPFGDNDLSDIKQGDSLVIYCYDAEINSDGTSCEDLASQNGGAWGGKPQAAGGGAGANAKLKLDKPKLTGTTINGSVHWPPGTTKGGVFLVLANRKGDFRKHTRKICVCCLTAPKPGTLPPSGYTFQNIDSDQWTHIHVIAVTYKHQTGKPTVVQIKPPPAK